MNRLPLDRINTTATGRLAATPDSDAALERDIRTNGIIEPLVLSPRPDGMYDVISGNRRVRIARKIGLTDAPYTEKKTDDAYNEGTMMNLLHAPLRDIEIADFVLQQFNAAHKGNPDDTLATLHAIRKDPSSNPEAVRVIARVVKNMGQGSWEDYLPGLLKLYKLPDDVIAPLRNAEISSQQASVIKSVKNPEERTKLIQKATDENLTAKDLRQEIKDRGLSASKDTKDAPVKPDPIHDTPPNPVVESAKNQLLDQASRELSDIDREKVRKAFAQIELVFRKSKKK